MLKIFLTGFCAFAGGAVMAQDTTGGTSPQVIIPLGKKKPTTQNATIAAPLMMADTTIDVYLPGSGKIKPKSKNKAAQKKVKPAAKKTL